MPHNKASSLDKEFITFLKHQMKDNGWSYQELAKRAGINRSTLYRIVSGDRLVSLGLVARIAERLDIPFAKIFPKALKLR